MYYVQVESVADSAAKVEELGGKVIMPKTPVPGMGWFAHFSDTEGNVFALWEDFVQTIRDSAAAAGAPLIGEVDGAGPNAPREDLVPDRGLRLSELEPDVSSVSAVAARSMPPRPARCCARWAATLTITLARAR